MKLLGDKVLVERQMEYKVGSIYIPDDPNRRARKGVVVGVGHGKQTPGYVKNGKKVPGKFVPTTVKTGDTVYYWRNYGEPVHIAEKEYVQMFEDQILAYDSRTR